MKREAILDFYMVNGVLCPTEEDQIFQDIQSQSIYEVIRVVNKVPLYLEEHLERMRKSAALVDDSIFKSDEEIVGEMMKLMEANKHPNMNIKLLCHGFDREEQIFLQYFVESHYPEKHVYDTGIHTILFHSERENPNAKVMNLDLRKRIGEMMKLEGAFEAILVNQDGYITEGSRSNIFYVRGNQVYTAPSGEVLLGVTRMRIIEVCKNLGISVVEQHIHETEISRMEGAFMTGTSVNVLPIRSTGAHSFASVHHPIIERIAKGYEEDMDAYRKSREI
jgi:branched-chain amino acid aminotransferase